MIFKNNPSPFEVVRNCFDVWFQSILEADRHLTEPCEQAASDACEKFVSVHYQSFVSCCEYFSKVMSFIQENKFQSKQNQISVSLKDNFCSIKYSSVKFLFQSNTQIQILTRSQSIHELFFF